MSDFTSADVAEAKWRLGILNAQRIAGVEKIAVGKIPGHPNRLWGWLCPECYGTPEWSHSQTEYFGVRYTQAQAWAAAENHWHRHLGRGKRK